MEKPAPSFQETREFQNFKNVMRKLVAVPKAELDKKLNRDQKKPKVLSHKPTKPQPNQESR